MTILALDSARPRWHRALGSHILARLRATPHAMIYWTGLPDFDERFDEPNESGAQRERSIAGRRARLVRWSLLLWVSQILVLALFFAFD